MRALEERLGIGEQALLAFFRAIGEAKVPPEQQATKLAEIAARFNELREQVVVTADDDAEVARLKTEAQVALDAGRLDDADALLAAIFDAQGRAIERRALEQAETAAQRGDLALTRLRYRDAARQLALAARTVPRGEDERRLDYLRREASALYKQGGEAGDNEALADSISRWRDLLAAYPRERVPLDWAMTQNNLGNALQTLGQRETGTARLLEAVAAYRLALDERTRERAPLLWAATQNNLGNALVMQGVHARDPDLLREALNCLKDARAVLVDEAGQTHRAAEFDGKLADIKAALSALSAGG